MRSIDIKGLAVFDIASGCEIGKVTELLINAEKKSVQYLVVDVPNWYYGALFV
jgi:sporulation protein YlmC with PRC-barrel domain